MIIVERVIGNAADPDWEARLAGAAIDWLMLDQWEAQKSRLRKPTAGQVELALSLDRNMHLHDGDILVWDEAARQAILARIELKEVMVIDLGDVVTGGRENLVPTVFELGHALGKQHWPAVVKGTRVYVPLTVDRKVMASVMKTHALPGVRYAFMPGAEVIPYLAPHESRRLFGGASATPHSHTHEYDRDHHDDHHHGHEQGQGH